MRASARWARAHHRPPAPVGGAERAEALECGVAKRGDGMPLRISLVAHPGLTARLGALGKGVARRAHTTRRPGLRIFPTPNPNPVPPVSPVPRTAATRLWFAWTLLWYLLATPPLWVLWVVALRLWPTSRTFSGWLAAWARVVLGGCGFRIRGVVAERPCGAVVYVANHQAMLDIPALALAIPAPFVARSELRRLPLVGSILSHSLCVFVDRRAGPRRRSPRRRTAPSGR